MFLNTAQNESELFIAHMEENELHAKSGEMLLQRLDCESVAEQVFRPWAVESLGGLFLSSQPRVGYSAF